MSTAQLLSNILLCLSLIFQCSFAVSPFGKIVPRFPSALIHPEMAAMGPMRPGYFTQVLDHFGFRPEGYQTFQQRYLINSTFWGGPWRNAPILWFAQNTGFMFEMAPCFNALLVFIEHRFYGKSIPFGGNKEVASSNSSTLGYLSSTQALADYATQITDLKKNWTAEDSPVVVFGGSYGGILFIENAAMPAAWFRLKYPHIAIGALSSSSPVLNFDNISSPYSFNDIITRGFRSESKNCCKVIKRSWNSMDAGYLQGWLQTALVYTAMTDYPTPSNFLSPLPAYPVKRMCKAIDDPSKEDDDFAKLYATASIYYNYSGGVSCFDLMDNSDSRGLGRRGWKYNYNHNYTCTSDSIVIPSPTWIPIAFGGHDIRRTLRRFGSNIIFFNGLRDPWSGGGVLKSISKSIVAIVAKKVTFNRRKLSMMGAHHADLLYSTNEDPKWLQDVRKKEIKIISSWISRYYRDLAKSSSQFRFSNS
ncbi:hypothetical protein ACJRO7_002620 [Eucalyptus globulus]|uniref:Lysosomal Pro-X carboxypeptidase n=1 Tax=Eucalyptus globulus TaxID=34317 RepID=A0ABD3LV16_EUCGL